MRAAAVLRNAAQAAKPKPMSADHTKYHLASTGFWKKFRDVMVVNPEISSGLPLPDKHRYPPPGSRPEAYATPATSASDVAFNPYWKRDTRRMYPRTSVVTQSELSALLISSPAAGAVTDGSSSTAVTAETAPDLTVAIQKLPAGRAFEAAGIATASAADSMPPSPPAFRGNQGKWVAKPGDAIPAPKYAYFPIVGYT